MCALITENPCNLDAYWIIEISSVLHSIYVIPRDQNKFMFYVNNYIDWNKFNQLYDPDWMKKGIRNANAIARKLGPASTRATNDRLKVAKEKRRKREVMMERRKAEFIAAKRRRTREGISLSNKEEDGNDTEDDTDPDRADLDQANDKYPVELWEGMRWKLQVTK